MSFAGQNDRPSSAITIPKECFAVERIARPINKRRSQRNDGKACALVQAEQCTLAHRLVPRINVWMIVRGQRIALMVIQAITVSRHARHENVAAYLAIKDLRGSFDLRAGGSPLPVVNIVE